MAWTYEELEFPKKDNHKYCGISIFPELYSFDDDTFVHPIVKLIKDGKKIEAVSVEDEWDDDHLPCFNIIVTIEGKKYGFSGWCFGQSGCRMLYRAELLNDTAIQQLRELIIETSQPVD